MINPFKKGAWTLLLAFGFLSSTHLSAQLSIDLQSCYELAEQNYPLVRQYELLEKSEEYSLEQVAAGNLPQLRLGGQLSYQSDVTEIPFSLPGTDIPHIDKDQYKMYIDVSQPITDLFTTQKRRKELTQKEAEVRTKSLDTEMYQLKERINHLYFGILLIDRQIDQAGLMKEQIESGIQINKVAVANGVALRSSTRLLEVESLKIEKRLIDLKANRKAFVQRLSLFTGEDLNEDILLSEPAEVPIYNENHRPELALFEARKEVFQTQKRLIDDRNLPSLNLFGQGGYGKPGLNMLSNKSELYYMAGLRLSWDLSRLYTKKADLQLLNIQQSLVDAEQESFLFNTEQSLTVYNQEIEKMDALIAVDHQIIEHRSTISKTAESQLKNGVLTTNDYLTYLREEDEARQYLLLHRVKRLKAMYDYKTTSGN